MFISSHPTHIRVIFTIPEWNARPEDHRGLILAETMKVSYGRRFVKLYFERRDWLKARQFFPELMEKLPKTHQNL